MVPSSIIKNKVVIGTIPVGPPIGPIACAVIRNQVWVVNGNFNTIVPVVGTVSIIDTISLDIIEIIGVGFCPNSLLVFNGKVYVTNSGDNTITIIDSSNYNLSSITVGNNPIALTALGNFIYVANSGSNSISVVNTSNDLVIATIPVGIFPQALISNNNKVYVANGGYNNEPSIITIISIS